MGEDRTMLPIQAILNHPCSYVRPESPSSQPSASESPSPTSETADTLQLVPEQPGVLRRTKKARDSSDLSYMRPQGPIKYPPFEKLDAIALNLMRPFNIYPFGEIAQYCAHIPYSSDKKDVYKKTGRESFNVFVYRFTDPTDGQTYDVMWDYLGGFVRVSPFFKSRKHKKTGPAKMLDANKGLRDITFHMTGGNRVAQGYWIPYPCARAVCAAFCHPIAGALIPIFGPDFPSDCLPPDSPRFGCMEIDDQIIQRAKLEVKAYRHASPSRPTSSSMPGPATVSVTSNPSRSFHDQYSMNMMERLENYTNSRRPGDNYPPLSNYSGSNPATAPASPSSAPHYPPPPPRAPDARWHGHTPSPREMSRTLPPLPPHPPPHPRIPGASMSSWTPINVRPGPTYRDALPDPDNPWLTAVPRSSSTAMQAPAPTRSETQPPKRRWHPEHEDDSLDDPYKRPRLHVHVPPPPPTRHHTALPGGTVQQHHAAARDDSRSRKDFEAARILMDMPATDVSREPAIAEEEEEHPRSV